MINYKVFEEEVVLIPRVEFMDNRPTLSRRVKRIRHFRWTNTLNFPRSSKLV